MQPGRTRRLGGVDDLAAGLPRQIGTDGADPPVRDRDVGLERTLGGDDRAAGDDQIGQSVPSVISMSWAPSHSTRRPSSGSCSAPVTTVAKWFPASWPSLLEKSHAP